MSAIYTDDIFNTVCPTCGLGPRVRCISANGQTAPRPHAARVKAAQERPSKDDSSASAPKAEPLSRKEACEAVSDAKLAKITERIGQLIAHAEGTDNEAEAATFMAKAEELMTTYAITRAQADGKLKYKRDVTPRMFKYEGAAHFWKALGLVGSQRISDAIGLTGIAFYQNLKGVLLYGMEEDTEYVEKMIRSTWRQAYAHFRIWKKLDPAYAQFDKHTKAGARLAYESEQSFLFGFCSGFAARIKQAHDATVEAAGGELVLASRQQEIQDVMNSNTKVMRKRTVPTTVGYIEGYLAGQSASVGNEVAK